MDLAAYRGERRLFLIFAPAPNDDAYAHQERLLEGSEAGFAERDLARGGGRCARGGMRVRRYGAR